MKDSDLEIITAFPSVPANTHPRAHPNSQLHLTAQAFQGRRNLVRYRQHANYFFYLYTVDRPFLLSYCSLFTLVRTDPFNLSYRDLLPLCLCSVPGDPSPDNFGWVQPI